MKSCSAGWSRSHRWSRKASGAGATPPCFISTVHFQIKITLKLSYLVTGVVVSHFSDDPASQHVPMVTAQLILVVSVTSRCKTGFISDTVNLLDRVILFNLILRQADILIAFILPNDSEEQSPPPPPPADETHSVSAKQSLLYFVLVWILDDNDRFLLGGGGRTNESPDSDSVRGLSVTPPPPHILSQLPPSNRRPHHYPGTDFALFCASIHFCIRSQSRKCGARSYFIKLHAAIGQTCLCTTVAHKCLICMI